jgi:cell wall-associated NlpC family hydrolase
MIDTQKYLHKKYKFNGRGEEGYDCLGLMLEILRDNGINLPNGDGREIDENWQEKKPQRFIEGLSNYFNQINFEDRQPLDVVVFLIYGIPRHSGVVIDDYRFIHITENSKVHISKLPKWKNRIHSIWRAR